MRGCLDLGVYDVRAHAPRKLSSLADVTNLAGLWTTQSIDDVLHYADPHFATTVMCGPSVRP